MGLNDVYIAFIDDCINTSMKNFRGKKMLELGNQIIRKGNISEKTGKEYYKNRGVIHTSIDLNGEDGALKIDLSKQFMDKKWSNGFDIITNSGTTEHIEPKKAQYIAFMNIHNWMKVGGIAVHLVPDINELEINGKWRKHCNNYYSMNFFEILAYENNYELKSLKIINGLVCACLKKMQDNPFMNDEYKFLNAIVRKKGGIVYPGINEIGIRKIIRSLRSLVGNYSSN